MQPSYISILRLFVKKKKCAIFFTTLLFVGVLLQKRTKGNTIWVWSWLHPLILDTGFNPIKVSNEADVKLYPPIIIYLEPHFSFFFTLKKNTSVLKKMHFCTGTGNGRNLLIWRAAAEVKNTKVKCILKWAKDSKQASEECILAG